MIHFPKTPRPDLKKLLDAEAEKASGSYDLHEVQEQLDRDFHKKCYLCEDDELTKIETEHLSPHCGDKRLKFSWENLFNACGHCNNTKGDKYNPILDCTRAEDFVEEQIELSMKLFPKTSVDVKGHPRPGMEESCENTVCLVKAIYSGTTQKKKREAENLRSRLLRQHNKFLKVLLSDPLTVEHFLPFVCRSAPFAGLHRWYLRRNRPDLWKAVAEHPGLAG